MQIFHLIFFPIRISRHKLKANACKTKFTNFYNCRISSKCRSFKFKFTSRNIYKTRKCFQYRDRVLQKYEGSLVLKNQKRKEKRNVFFLDPMVLHHTTAVSIYSLSPEFNGSPCVHQIVVEYLFIENPVDS